MIEKRNYVEDNPITRRRNAEEESCSVEQRRKLDKLSNMHWKEYSLKKIKRQKITPKKEMFFWYLQKKICFFMVS